MQVKYPLGAKQPTIIASILQRLSILEKKVANVQAFGGPAGVTSPDSSLSGNLVIAQTDFTPFSTSGSSNVQITNAWTIPAGDAVVGTTYRLKAFGQGAVGATASVVGWNMFAFGSTEAATGLNVSVIVSESFAWSLTGTLIIVSSSEAHFELEGTVTAGAATGGRTGGSSSSYVFNANSLSVTLPLTADAQMYLMGAFGSPGSGTTMTCNFSLFERF